MKTEEISFTKPNRRIFTFVKRPDFKLEPQAEAILNTIEASGPLNRFELLKLLAGILETTSTVSKVLSYHQRFLVRFGAIMVEEPSEHRQRLEAEKRAQTMKAKVVRNTMGGWGVSTLENDVWTAPIGHYPEKVDAIRIIELNHFQLLVEREEPISHTS